MLLEGRSVKITHGRVQNAPSNAKSSSFCPNAGNNEVFLSFAQSDPVMALVIRPLTLQKIKLIFKMMFLVRVVRERNLIRDDLGNRLLLA